jgi:hypothetical protein
VKDLTLIQIHSQLLFFFLVALQSGYVDTCFSCEKTYITEHAMQGRLITSGRLFFGLSHLMLVVFHAAELLESLSVGTRVGLGFSERHALFMYDSSDTLPWSSGFAETELTSTKPIARASRTKSETTSPPRANPRTRSVAD